MAKPRDVCKRKILLKLNTTTTFLPLVVGSTNELTVRKRETNRPPSLIHIVKINVERTTLLGYRSCKKVWENSSIRSVMLMQEPTGCKRNTREDRLENHCISTALGPIRGINVCLLSAYNRNQLSFPASSPLTRKSCFCILLKILTIVIMVRLANVLDFIIRSRRD